MANLPTGTVTFLFTDIEGSTALIQRPGEQRVPVHVQNVEHHVAEVTGQFPVPWPEPSLERLEVGPAFCR
jgi:class 3 adenylate cyclase